MAFMDLFGKAKPPVKHPVPAQPKGATPKGQAVKGK